MRFIYFLFIDNALLVDQQLEIHVVLLQATHTCTIIDDNATFSLGCAHIAVIGLSDTQHFDCLEIAGFHVGFFRFLFHWSHWWFFINFIFNTILFAFSTTYVRWLESVGWLVDSQIELALVGLELLF